MKQSKITQACKVLNSLSEQRLPLPISYKIMKLRKALQTAWEFQIQEEQRIFSLFPPESIEDNHYKFKTPEDAQGFKDAFDELAEMENDIEFTPLNLPLMNEMSLSAKDIEALQDFVFFTEPEGTLTK